MHFQRWGVSGGSWFLNGPWGDPWGSLGIPRASLGALGAPGMSLWGPRGALGGSPGDTAIIGRHYVVTVLAAFGP